MNENFDDLSARLQAADPAANLEAPHESLIHRAIADADTGAESGSSQKPANKRINFLKPRNRIALVRGLSTAGVMAVALAFAAPSILGAFPSGSGTSYLFSLAGNNVGSQKMSASSALVGSAATVAGGSMDAAVCRGFDGNPCGIMPTEYNYVAAPGLSDASGNAAVYKLQPTRSASETLTLLAAQFGITGTTKTGSAADNWNVIYKGLNPDGSDGWGKPQLVVSYDTGSMVPQWSYTGNPMLYTDCANGDAAAKGLDVPILDPNKVEPNTSTCMVGISGRGPTTAEALVSAKKIFKAIGFDSSANLGSVHNGDLYIELPSDPNTARNGVSITGYLMVGGSLTSMTQTVSWDGSSKDISYGYGFDGEAVSQGSFGTVSASAAVERLGNWQWYGNPYLDYANLKYSETMNQGIAIDVVQSPSASSDTTGGTSTGTSSSGVVPAGSGGLNTVAPDPNATAPTGVAPSEVAPTPQVVNVTVTRAQSALMTLYAADGTIWFVPGFVFYDATGYVGNVLSIVPGVIKLPEVTPLTDVQVK
jgi:hypothetical protein